MCSSIPSLRPCCPRLQVLQRRLPAQALARKASSWEADRRPWSMEAEVTRTRWLPAVLAGVGLLVAVADVRAQQNAASYPSKPVKIIVNVSPGGGVDTATR